MSGSGRSEISRHATDPYAGWAPGELYASAMRERGLVDTPEARDWFQRIDECRGSGLYSYALPMDGLSGARSQYFGRSIVSFSTYGYLGLNGHPRITAAAVRAVERFGTSTGGARLLTGTVSLHNEAEQAIAEWLGREDCAIFASGYDANLAAISSLFGPRDVAVLDRLAHRSLVDGCRLAGMRIAWFRHNDVGHLGSVAAEAAGAGGRMLIVVDGVYSMDGDQAPLAEVVAVKRRHGAFLLVDESHALGVFGPAGEGAVAAQGVDPADVDLTTSSLGKALPSGGGMVAGSRALVTYLRHGSAPFLFSSATSPANTAAIVEAVAVVRSEPEHRQRLWANSDRLHELVRRLGFDEHGSTSPIVPFVLGHTARAFIWARYMLEHGVYVSCVPAPAVAVGTERLRLCATAGHRPEDFDALERALRECLALEADPDRAVATIRGFAPAPPPAHP